MIPPIGFFRIEKLACILMAMAGLTGLLLVLTGSADWVLTAFITVFGEKYPTARINSFWLVLQSLAVIAGGIGAWRSTSITLAGIGVASSLILQTAVGHITFYPGVLMLILIVGRLRSFRPFQGGLRPISPDAYEALRRSERRPSDQEPR